MRVAQSQEAAACGPEPHTFPEAAMRVLLARSVLFLHPTAQVTGNLCDIVGLVLDGRTNILPDGQHTSPHFGSNFVVLEVLAITNRRACADLGTGADYGDPEDRSGL